MSRALDGDQALLRRLVEFLTPPIQAEVAYALHRRGAARGRDARQEVEDMVHEVFIRLLGDGGRLLRNWAPERGSGLPGYVRLVARCQVATVMRSGRRNPWKDEPTDGETIERMSTAAEDVDRRVTEADTLRRLVMRLEERLDDRGMLLFRMLWVEERPIEEACAVTGMSRDAIYAWRFRVRKLATKLVAEDSL